jgi:hypothetical protein
MSSAKFYIKYPAEKRTPPKKTTTTTTNPYQTNLAQKSCKPLPSLPRRIQFPLLNTRIGERELHRWLVGFPERRRTPWDAAGRHCVREGRGIDKAKTKRSTEREQQQHKRRRRRRKARHQKPIAGSVRQTTTTTAARPPARPPVTAYSRSPWHKYRLGKCDRRPRAPPPPPHQPGNYPDLKSQNVFGTS